MARSWWRPQLLDVYLKHKRGEIALLARLNEEEQARRYAAVYWPAIRRCDFERASARGATGHGKVLLTS